MNNSLTRSKYSSEVPGFNPEKNVSILNPLSNDLDVMRQSLFFGGMESIIYNINRKIADLRIFEFGRMYRYDAKADTSRDELKPYKEYEHLALWMTGRKYPESWHTPDSTVGFYDMKSFVEIILNRLGFEVLKLELNTLDEGFFSNGLKYGSRDRTYVEFGQIDKKALKVWDIKQDVFYADFRWDNMLHALAGHAVKYSGVPKFPEVRRDLALVLDKDISFAELEQLAYKTERKLLRKVNLFDVYEGDKIPQGKKSYAISFILRDDEKTLTDKVIEKTMGKIQKGIENEFGASIR
jgi:phenylalanyl-tRNA synthetase beta chain